MSIGISRHSRSVMLVSGEQQSRTSLRNTLSAQGFRVFEANDGFEALEMAKSLGGSLHLLITEVVISRCDGVTLATRLAARNPALRILFTSADCHDVLFLDPGLRQRTSFLSKPFRNSELLQRVRTLLLKPASDAAASGTRSNGLQSRTGSA